MTINIKNLFSYGKRITKMGDFQEVHHIDGLQVSSVSANLYKKEREDLSLFYFPEGANHAVAYTKNSIVSESIINNPKKIGFNAPIEDLLDTSDPKVREFLLDDSQIFDLINKKKIEELSKKKNLSNSESKFIFNFLNIKIFLESAKLNC